MTSGHPTIHVSQATSNINGDDPNVGVQAESFLSSAVKDMVSRELTEAEVQQARKIPIVVDGLTLNWDVFDCEVPAPESADAGEQAGLHVQAAHRLHVLAEAANIFMKEQAHVHQAALPELCDGRTHGELLLSLVHSYIQRLQAEADPTASPDKLPFVEPSGHSVPDSVHRLGSMLLACSLIERSLIDLYASRAVELFGPGAAPPPPLLRDLLQSEVLAASLPRGVSSWLTKLFHPKCVNLRNVAWHGFLLPEEARPRLLALLLLLALSLPKAPPRPLADLSVHAASYSAAAAPPLPRVLFSLSPGAAATTAILDLLSTSPFVPGPHRKVLRAAVEAYAEGAVTLFSLLAISVLEHALRLVFARQNRTPIVTLAHASHYFSTLDGYGQVSKHQLLLAPVLHPSVAASRKAVPCAEAEGGGSSSDGARAARAEEADGEHSDAEKEAANALCAWLGYGALSCLQDLFIMEHGPRVRGKLAHGDIALPRQYGAGPRAEGADAVPTSGGGTLERHQELPAVLLALIVSLCAGAEGAAPEAGGGDGVVEQCRAYIGKYTPVFHPLRLLDDEMQRFKSALGRLTNVLRRYAPSQPEPLVPADEEASASAEWSLSVGVDGGDALVIRDGKNRVLRTEAQVLATSEHCVVAHRLRALLVPLIGVEEPSTRSDAGDSTWACIDAMLEALSSSAAPSSLDALQRQGTIAFPAMDCIRGCTRLGAQLAGEVGARLERMEASIRGRTARTLERRQFVQLLYEAPALFLALLTVAAVIDNQAISGNQTLFQLFTKMIVFLEGSYALVEKAQYGDAVRRAQQFFATKLFKAALEKPFRRHRDDHDHDGRGPLPAQA